MFVDCHVHSSLGCDKGEPRLEVEAAIDKGLAGLTFTEHWESDPEMRSLVKRESKGKVEKMYDYERVSAGVEQLRQEFPTVFIGAGVECDLRPQMCHELPRTLESWNLDLVLGSTHDVYGIPVFSRKLYEGRTAEEACRAYWEQMLEVVSLIGPQRTASGQPVVNVMAHFDEIFPWILAYKGERSPQYSEELITEALKIMVEYGIGLEINTRDLMWSLRSTKPGVWIVKKFRDAGGEIITFGSDTHEHTKIGYGFDVAAEMAKEAGFRFVTHFANRQPTFTRL